MAIDRNPGDDRRVDKQRLPDFVRRISLCPRPLLVFDHGETSYEARVSHAVVMTAHKKGRNVDLVICCVS